MRAGRGIDESEERPCRYCRGGLLDRHDCGGRILPQCATQRHAAVYRPRNRRPPDFDEERRPSADGRADAAGSYNRAVRSYYIAARAAPACDRRRPQASRGRASPAPRYVSPRSNLVHHRPSSILAMQGIEVRSNPESGHHGPFVEVIYGPQADSCTAANGYSIQLPRRHGRAASAGCRYRVVSRS